MGQECMGDGGVESESVEGFMKERGIWKNMDFLFFNCFGGDVR